MEKTNNEPEKVYLDINPDVPINEIESLCMNCGKNGVTRILLTKIPFFKDIILMAFECTHCGNRNNEVQAASSLADYGIKFVVKIVNSRDLNRKIVKTEFADISIPYCGLEIPAKTQKGKLSTIEGFLSTARDDMQKALETGVYDEMEKSSIEKIQETIKKISNVLDESALPVELILTDPSGNSFIENPFAPNNDVYCKVTHFIRSKEVAEAMGYSYHNEQESNVSKTVKEKLPFEVYKSNSHISAHLMDMTKSVEDNEGSDAIVIPEVCLVCKKMGENRVCVITIPFFKELIITCFSCNECNFKSCEVKGGGGISDKGQKITLTLTEPNDLNRDMFKSETSQIIIPELCFESSAGSLGSMFTTVEGLLQKLISNIKDTAFTQGDSGQSEDKSKFDDFVARVENFKDNFKPFTLIIDDPAANSFIFSINHENPENDKNLKIEEYERSWEQNEELGLNNMIVEDYEENFAKEKKIEDSKKIGVIKEEDIEEYDKTD